MKAYWSSEKQMTPPASICHDVDRNALVFHVAGTEVLAVHHDGDVVVHGRVCGRDEEGAVFSALLTFCTRVRELNGKDPE